MTSIRSVKVFNEITRRWSTLHVAMGEDGELDMKEIERILREKRIAEGNDEDFEVIKVNIPKGVDYVVPVSTLDEMKANKEMRRKNRLKRELSINMKY